MRFGFTAILLLCFASSLCAGVVQTVDGKRYEGEVALDRDSVLLTPARGTAIAFPLNSVRQATLFIPDPATRHDWTDVDVGVVRFPGTTKLDGELLRMTFSGFGFGSAKKRQARPDAFHLRYQGFVGDGQIVARLRTMSASRNGKVGLMIRESLDPAASAAAIFCEEDPVHIAQFLARSAPGEFFAADAASERAVLGALWLKLVRSGDQFQGFESLDGKTWKLVGEQKIAMRSTGDVYFGLIAASGASNTPGEALLDHVEFTAGAAGAPILPTPAMGFVTTAGSIVEARVIALGEKTLKFAYANGPEQTLPITDVARLIFSARYSLVAEHITAGKTGVLLPGGDFVEAQVDRVADGQVRINSVLFGIKSFELRREVAAVVIGDVKSAGAWEVRKRNDSSFRTDLLQIAGNGVTIQDAILGEIRIPATEIAELKRLAK